MTLRRRLNTRNQSRRPETPLVESLEGRMLLTGFSWTAEEVYLAELVNRARANPLAEQARLGVDLTAGLTPGELARLVPQEPLALNQALTVAARAHSQDMVTRDFFDHVNPDGDDPTDRAQDAGYNGTAGENIAAGYTDVDASHLAWLQSLGHRKNVFSLHESFDDEFHYDEFGAGVLFSGVGPFFNYYTQLFGAQGAPIRRFVLGAVYNDTNSNQFYTIGEGMANVQIDVAPLTEPWNVIGTYTTDAAGNYQIPVTAGSYVIRFKNLANDRERVVYFSVDDQNVKINARAQQMTDPTDTTFRAVYGRSIQASSSNSGQISLSTINQNGLPIAIQQDGEGWAGYDLDPLTGAPDVTGQVVSWTDPKDGLLYAAASGHSGVILYKKSNGGTWSYRNLSTETGGANVPTGQMVLLQGADSIIRLAGLTGSGDVALYSQTGGGGAGSYEWSFSNLTTDHILPQNQHMPEFVGNLTGYVTSWNGLNVAGLDENGQIHAIWWAPGLDLWQSTNLSAITGAPAFQGGLTAYMTPWDGINLAGIAQDGTLSITWWVPAFGGEWRTNNLTDEFDGPLVVPTSVSSYVSSWGGINITGIDQAGRVIVYWWSPQNTELGWQIAPLSEDIPGAPRFEGRLTGLAAANGTLNIFGYFDNGKIGRYTWQPGGDWSFQDVTAQTVG